MRQILLRLAIVCLIAIPALALDEDTSYTITLKKSARGDRATVDSTDVGDVRFKIEVMGQELNKGEAKTVKHRYTEEILTKEDGAKKSSRLSRKYEVAEYTKEGKRTIHDYQGKTVLIEKKGKKYVFTVDGKEITGEDAEELESEFNKEDDIPLDDQDLMPEKAVKVGESWTVKTKKVVDAFETGGPFTLDIEKTKIVGKLVRVDLRDGKRFGVIDLTATLGVKELKLDGQELPMKPGSKVTATTRFDICIDGTSHSGTEKTTLVFDLHGDIPNGTLAVTGKVKLDKSVVDLRKK